MRGAVKSCQPGTTLGHEGIGEVVAVGAKVSKYAVGDRVLVPCITRCGKCEMCEHKFYGHCADGGWLLGHTIDGMQAEYARIPHVDASCYRLPKGIAPGSAEEEKFVMLSDILPTAFETGFLDAAAIRGATIGIIGAGPVGLSAVLIAASKYEPSTLVVVDVDEHRLEVAKRCGATHVIDNKDGGAAARIKALTGENGLDLVVECIGVPAGWYVCQDTVRPGGTIAVLGVHGEPVTLNLERMWSANFKLSAGLVHGFSIDDLMEDVRNGTIDSGQLISHHFSMRKDGLDVAYETFGNAADSRSLKVIITNDFDENVHRPEDRWVDLPVQMSRL